MSERATFLQIDLQNLFESTKDKKERIDFDKIWGHFHERETEFLTQAIVYMLRSPGFDSSKFEAKLVTLGYQVKAKNVPKLKVGMKSPTHDVLMTIDALDRINTYDKLILMSGDGDFADLCRYLKDRGKQIEIWGFKENYDSALESYADRLQLFDEGFFYRKPRVTVFGFNWGSLQ